MMVPRAFLLSSVSPQRTSRQNGSTTTITPPAKGSHAIQDGFGLQLPGAVSVENSAPTHTSPVVIPPKRSPRMTPVHQGPGGNDNRASRNSRNLRRSSSMALGDRNLPTSVASILEATAIPVPRRSWSVRESRKLRRGNHVEDFSKLLMEGVKSKEESLIDGPGNSPLDILLGPPEEENEKLSLANEYDPDTPFSIRSVSTDSMPSLDQDFDSPSSVSVPLTPPSQRSPLERKYRIISPSEDCAFDHPLLNVDVPELESEPVVEDLSVPDSTSTKTPSSLRPFPRLRSSFRSNLTASLRAIKSAAQTVSTFATPSVQPDDFLTRSLFTITPKLTDDRRPLPMQEPPSPALRRYLNPIAVSPAEMHTYHDHPHDFPEYSRKCPVSIQMQTYHRSGGNGSRKGGFRVATADGRDRQVSGFDPEIPPISRQREPRENSDFLRMVVLEMNMRRVGKLRDDIPMRAKIWLPPRKENANRLHPCSDGEEDEKAVPSRWIGVSVSCI